MTELLVGGGRIVHKLQKKNGRHEETRTPDLYRVNDELTSIFNNLHVTGRNRKLLKNKIDPNKAFLIVHEVCLNEKVCNVAFCVRLTTPNAASVSDWLGDISSGVAAYGPRLMSS